MKRHSLHIPIVFVAITVLVSACSSPVTSVPATSVAEAPAATATAPQPTATDRPATPTTASTPTVITTQTATTETTAEADATATASDTQVLDAAWYLDSDDNAVPDTLEAELGYDPLADDCAENACGPAAEGADFEQERNTLLIFDSSGSMAAPVAGERKIDAAKAALRRYVQGVANFYHLGFMVYGHKGNNSDAGKAESCVGIDLLAPLGHVQRDSFQNVLDQFQPTGWTPIAAALTKAQDAFAGKDGQLNRIILVSDGIETCEGDPVAAAEQLFNSGIAVQVNVIGFDIANQDEIAQLRRIAEVTGGTYYDAKSRAELDAYFTEQMQALQQTNEALQCEYDNFVRKGNCDSKLVNEATSRLTEIQEEYTDAFATMSPDEYKVKRAEYDAYTKIYQQIYAALRERDAARQAANEKYLDYTQHSAELMEQLRTASQP